MTLAPVDPGTITVEEITEFLDQNTPCETPHGECASNYEQPATWITTHKGAKPSCTKLICEPCSVPIKQVIFITKLLRIHAACAACMTHCHGEDIILRPIGG